MTAPKPPLGHFVIVLLMSVTCFGQGINSRCWKDGHWEEKAVDINAANDVCYHGATFGDWTKAGESHDKALAVCRKQKWKGSATHYDAWFRKWESVSCQTAREVWAKPDIPANIQADPNMPVLYGGDAEKTIPLITSGTDITGTTSITAHALTMPPVPKTAKEAAERLKQAHSFMFTDGKMELHTEAGKIATLYEDGRIEMEKGHTLEELTWLILWSQYVK